MLDTRSSLERLDRGNLPLVSAVRCVAFCKRRLLLKAREMLVVDPDEFLATLMA